MPRLVHVVLALTILLGLTSLEPASATQTDNTLDLADVPLPVQALPESGYQVLAGGYLEPDDIASLIANPRNLDPGSLGDTGIARAYVLDLVLPEDRAWRDSPAIAVVQTSIYLIAESESPDQLIGWLGNYSDTAFVQELDPAVPGAHTISMVGEAGDQLRTIVSDERIVIEIVSMDATGSPDQTEHVLIVEATLERLGTLRQQGGPGLSSMALSLLPDGSTSSFAHNSQTGTHGLYRYRDAGVQPAIGEFDADDLQPAQGARSIYVSSQAASIGGGTGIVSTWLGEFDTDAYASAFFDSAISTSPSAALVDPFFAIAAGETWTEQGVLGVYRVTGALNGQDYSGNVEVRQHGHIVVAVGYRSVGSTLPSTDITSSLMDHQLDCLEAGQVCPSFDLARQLPAPQATPVLDPGVIGSPGFGWWLPNLGSEWEVTEQFSEQGYDRIVMRNGLSIFEIESVINHHGEPVQCVLDELHLLEEFEQNSVITVWEDPAGNTDGGNTESHAWITYRVEPLAEERADQEYVLRIDCFALLPGSANVVVTHIAPVDFWMEEAPKGEILRDALEIPEGSGLHAKMGTPAHEWRTTMILIHGNDWAA